jgi:CheY-like chemotaxis protein
MSHKLLLADDSVTIQRVIELTFADEDIEVIAVGDGARAIQRIRDDRPDIVLADVDMPELDGFAVASFVKSDPELAHIRVILLTGAFEPVDEARVRAVGCDGVLAKPFEPQLLIARVRELLAGSTARPTTAASTTPGEPGSSTRQTRWEGVEQASAATSPLAGRPPVKEPGDAGRDHGPQGATPEDGGEDAQPVSLDEYFDQLDAAFASHGFAVDENEAGAAPPRGPVRAPFAADASAFGLAATDPHRQPALVPAVAPPLAVTFSALLAAEQGESAVPSQIPFFSVEAIVDEVTRRVIERMAESGVREQVADIVSRVADRLVREEIERVKASIK